MSDSVDTRPVTRVRIISTPPGNAPLEVREQWIGLELPVVPPHEGGVQMGVFGGDSQNIGGWEVRTKAAIDLLEIKSPAAADWWRNSGVLRRAQRLVFSKDVCQPCAHSTASGPWEYDLADTDPRVVVVATAIHDASNCCEVRDGEGCPRCFKDARVAVSAMIRNGFVRSG